MKKSLLLILSCILSFYVEKAASQEFEYNWTDAHGSNHTVNYTGSCWGSSYSYPCTQTAYPTFTMTEIAVDPADNTIQLGQFNRQFDIDSGEGTVILTPTPTLLSGGYGTTNYFNTDYYIAKRKPNGELMWAGSLSRNTATALSITDMETTADGDIIVLGSYTGNINFAMHGPAAFHTSTNHDIFIAKYSGLNGGLLWHKTISGNSSDYSEKLAVDSSGNIIISGRTISTSFKPDPNNVELVKTLENTSVFIGKYDANGNYQWSLFRRNYSSSYLAVDGSGNVYDAADYNGTFDLNATDDVTSFTSSGTHTFISKYSASGSYIWTKELKRDGGQTTSTTPRNFKIIGSGIYFSIAISPSYPTDVNPLPSSEILLSTGRSALVKWDLDGNYVAHYETPGTLSYQNFDISPDNKIAFEFSNYAGTDLDPGAAEFILPGANRGWVELSANLTFERAFGFNFNLGQISALKYDHQGRLYIGGSHVSNPASLNSNDLTQNSLEGMNVGVYNFFITRYGPPCDPESIAAPTGNANQPFCTSAIVADLQAEGTNILWYEEETGVEALENTAVLSTGTYYASQTIESCEGSNRLLVNVTIHNTPAPTGDAEQSVCHEGTLADLAIDGTDILWYASEESETALQADEVLTNGTTYYASQTANGCESIVRLAVTVTIDSLQVFYADADGDGFGNASVIVEACSQPAGYVSDSTDCDDQNADAHQSFMFFADLDHDGFGAGSLVMVCAADDLTPPAGFSLNDTDCDDQNADVHEMFTFFQDVDGDGYGAGSEVSVCAENALTPPAGYSLNDTDCDDNNVEIYQSASLFIDADGDGYDAGTEIVCYGLAVPSGYALLSNGADCDDDAATVYPGAAEIGYNLIDDDCDGLIDEGFPVKISTVAATTCNTVLPSIDTMIYSTLVAGAQGYQWRITTLSGPNAGQIQLLDTPLRSMKLTQLPNYAFGATYKIEVAVYFAGFLQPYAESTCTVSTPNTTTKLTHCGATMQAFTDVIFANAVSFATGYKFEITDPINPANTQEIERTLREFRLTNVTDFEVLYGKTYIVRVAVRNTDGTYLPYGQACSLTTSAYPTTSIGAAQCDDGFGLPYQVPAMSTPIYALSYPGAVGYAFRLTGIGLPPSGIEVIKPLRVFTLNDFAGMGLVPGRSYNVNVGLVFEHGAPIGSYGKTCTLTVPGGARVKQAEFDALAYPNPFEDNFSISISTSSNEKVILSMYDMTGRLLENRTFTVGEMKSYEIGNRYPAGVYNAIIKQGEDVKTIRVIKR